jgi:prophage regulatory protein
VMVRRAAVIEATSPTAPEGPATSGLSNDRLGTLGRSTTYRMKALGQFPQRIKLGLRAVGWMESEVQAWLAMHAKAREADRSYAVAAE